MTTAAQRLLDGNLEVLGRPVATSGGVPDWNRDPVTGTSLPLRFGLFIDPRHVSEELDIKYLWELNRHLWWVTLAQAYALTSNRAYAKRLALILDDWMEACPYPLGPNWTSPVEHGIRLINWSLVWHLTGADTSPLFTGAEGAERKQRWLDCIYRHVRFARDNYSFYSSADNHLIGEAAGIYIAARTWNLWRDVRKMGVEAKTLLEREAVKQFASDGVNREQAICYHKFSLQFLLSAGLCGRADGDEFSEQFWERIESGITFLAAVMDCLGRTPPVGDGDDSDVFRLDHEPRYNSSGSLLAIGARLFPQSAIAKKCRLLGLEQDSTAACLLGPAPPSRDAVPADLKEIPTRFEQGGYVILGHRLHQADELRVLLDVGALGYNRVAGHGHADALSIILSSRGQDLLVDPGTYCYNSAPELRKFFRGTAAHNTVVIDDRDQAEYGGSFLWLTDVSCDLREYHDDGNLIIVEATHDGYERLIDPVVHCRRVRLDRASGVLEVEDWLNCNGEHDISVYWHVAPGSQLEQLGPTSWYVKSGLLPWSIVMTGARLTGAQIVGRLYPPQGWLSPKFGVLEEAPVLLATGRVRREQRIQTLIHLGA